MKNLLLLMIIFISEARISIAQENTNKKRINFFVSTRTKKVDPATKSAQLQAWITNRLQKGKIYSMFVESPKEMEDRITAVLKKYDALIGNIWFDSHGHYNRRRSSFEIGGIEYNAQSITDSSVNIHFRNLAAYCDINTTVGIGSCYGGATYTLPAIEGFPEQHMQGNILMMNISRILSNATVFGSESFVMSGPGIFTAGYNLAGYPRMRKFKSPIYKPVWDHLGKWNCYNGKMGTFYPVTTVTLAHDGSIYCKQFEYLTIKNNREKQIKKILKFKQTNYNIASLYQN